MNIIYQTKIIILIPAKLLIEKHFYNNPDYIGGVDWQECELKGDTLYTKGFNKVLVGDKEVTAIFQKLRKRE